MMLKPFTTWFKYISSPCHQSYPADLKQTPGSTKMVLKSHFQPYTDKTLLFTSTETISKYLFTSLQLEENLYNTLVHPVNWRHNALSERREAAATDMMIIKPLARSYITSYLPQFIAFHLTSGGKEWRGAPPSRSSKDLVPLTARMLLGAVVQKSVYGTELYCDASPQGMEWGMKQRNIISVCKNSNLCHQPGLELTKFYTKKRKQMKKSEISNLGRY